MKRVLCLVLCAVLLLAVLPATAFGVSEDVRDVESLKEEIHNIYLKAKEEAGVESFDGYCGMLSSYQLWLMGINRQLSLCGNGKDLFDNYAEAGLTSGGYHITAYPAAEFDLEQALNVITCNGTKDVENILIGFESTTTPAGSEYGHACVIQAIRNGVAYFVENYDTSIAGEEGNVIAISLNSLVNFYKDWTVLDGVIHFEGKKYADSCKFLPTDIFVRTRFATTLRTEPSLVGKNDCTVRRSVSAGEMLHATAVVENGKGELYYRIKEGIHNGYVAAGSVSLSQLSPEALSTKDAGLPNVKEPGKDVSLEGTVNAKYCSVSQVRAQVTDSDGNILQEAVADASGSRFSLKNLNEQLEFDTLAEGSYNITLYATAASTVIRGKGLVNRYAEQKVWSRTFYVGETAIQQSRIQLTVSSQEMRDGWFLKDGLWYLYENGEPQMGWAYHLGAMYYLNLDGSVTVGWKEIDGQKRYFSATGALCKGWVTTGGETYYWNNSGVAAQGLQKIGGKLYYFDEAGELVKNETVELYGDTYEVANDGTATLVIPEESENETNKKGAA